MTSCASSRRCRPAPSAPASCCASCKAAAAPRRWGARSHEGRHSVARIIFHGNRGELRQPYRQGQEDQLAALGFALNILVLWNTQYMDDAVNHLRDVLERDESRDGLAEEQHEDARDARWELDVVGPQKRVRACEQGWAIDRFDARSRRRPTDLDRDGDARVVGPLQEIAQGKRAAGCVCERVRDEVLAHIDEAAAMVVQPAGEHDRDAQLAARVTVMFRLAAPVSMRRARSPWRPQLAYAAR
jgi:Tn3 transposase DDE domain